MIGKIENMDTIAPGSVTIARPCESTAIPYGRIVWCRSAAPATTSSTFRKKDRFGDTSRSVSNVRTNASFARPPAAAQAPESHRSSQL